MNPRRSFLASLALLPAAAIAAVKPRSHSPFKKVTPLPADMGQVTQMIIYQDRLFMATTTGVYHASLEDFK